MVVSQRVQSQDAPPDGGAAPAFRATSWLILGALLRHIPDRSLLARTADMAMALDASADGPLGAAWADLGDAARVIEPEPLDDEFHDLFIGVGRGELVPYASWYRTGFLMDRPLVALRRDLALLGFERNASVSEPEDHAAALAETMGLLADPVEGQDDSTQRLFFSEHIDSWMPDFFADLQSARKADFYRVVGRVGAAFVEFERGWLGAETPRADARTTTGVAKP